LCGFFKSIRAYFLRSSCAIKASHFTEEVKMKKLKILLIIFVAGLSAVPATGQNFTLSDAGLMSLDWYPGNAATITNRTNISGPGVLFYIHFPGNEQPDSVFQYLSCEYGGTGLLAGLDVSMYDAFELKFTIVSINGVSTPDVGGLISVGSVIGPYDGNSSAYRPAWIDLVGGPPYDPTAISSTSVKTDQTSLLGILVWLFDPSDWNPSGTNLTLLVEPVPGAVALPKLPAIYYVDVDAAGANNGSSWDDAFTNLQSALIAAESGDEVRVAQGIYTPEDPLLLRRASNPNPADGARSVSRTADLSWTAGEDATSHDVYFGTSSPGVFQGNQTATTFDPGTMAYSTTYYWRIDEFNNGSKTTGIVWSFTTTGAGPSMPPPEDLSVPPPPLDRTVTFQLKNDVVIKGGYAGFGEPNADARDIEVYETVLSSDIGIPGNSSDNSFHVVTGTGTDETAVLDGFTITAGNANEVYPSPHANGGGMYNYAGSPTLVNCTFTGNFATEEGGGMFNNIHSNPTLTGCTFRGNTSIIMGGAISNRTSSPTITNCNFIDNSSGYGGGISSWPGSPVVSDSKFSGNSASLFGGAIFNYDSSSPLTNCIFSNNYAEQIGGAICNLSSIVPLAPDNSSSPGEGTNIAKSIPLFADYAFSDDSSGYESSVNTLSDSSTLTNCKFVGNSSAIHGGGVCYIGESNPSLDSCTFVGNSAPNIGGAFIISQCTAILTDCTFSGNSGEWGGAYYSEFGNAMLINCIFRANTSSLFGAVMHEAASSSSLYNCLITGNSSSFYGGAMYYWYESSPQLFNCTFAGNSAPVGNAIVCAVPEGGGDVPPSTVSASNCIFRDGGYEIVNFDNSIITITYSDVEGGYSGAGNMTADPCFVEAGYSGPMAYWKLDETDGTTASDSVGFNHGNVYGAQWTTGQVGGALRFDGDNDFVSIPENQALNNPDAITLEAWIYPERDSHWHILDKGDGDKRIYAEGTTLSLEGRIRYSGNHAFARSASNTLILNMWQHVALTWSLSDNTTRLYHNGEEVSYSMRINGIGFVLDDRSHLWTIGARGALGEVTFFDGLIDEAAIHDRVLSADEIQRHYQAGLSGQTYPDINIPDYHLLAGSPCINTGDPDYIAQPDETDLDGKPRVIAGRIDMGAYEFNHIPVADAGPDQTVEAQAPWGANVTLDGSGSSDARHFPGKRPDYRLQPLNRRAYYHPRVNR
jgi:hypothetical protein